jgi:hypothetical protein
MTGPNPVSRAPMGRWITIGVLLLLAIGLFFWYAPDTEPAAPPASSVAP